MSYALFAGLATLDIQYFVDQYPDSNTKIKTNAPHLLVGGPATNAAVAYSFFTGKASLVTVIGDNPFQSVFESDFKKCGIDAIDLLKNKQSTPVLATVVTSRNNGDRTIFTHHPKELTEPIDLNLFFGDNNPDFIFTDGFYPELAFDLAREARKREIPVIFDGGSWKKHLTDLVPFIDVAICSNDFKPPGCTSHQDVFDFLISAGVKQIAISRGANAVHVFDNGVFDLVPVEPVQVCDTLGAGDFLHGAFCYFQQIEPSFKSGVQKASKFASATCTTHGTRDWLNKLEKKAFL